MESMPTSAFLVLSQQLCLWLRFVLQILTKICGPFAKFVDSPYYSESETLWRCGDGLFFEAPRLANDALLTTLHTLLENVLQTVDHFEISFPRSPFSWMERPRNRMGRDLNWILFLASKTWIGGTPLEHPPYSPYLAPCDFWAFPTINGLQHVFETLVERCKKCIACQGRYFEKETISTPPQSSDSE
jgi:hypothetical protein